MNTILLAFLACSGDEGKTDDSTNTGNSGPVFEDYVNSQVTYSGDTTCYNGEWLPAPTFCEGCQTDQTLAGLVNDFEKDEPVADASVEFYFNDTVNGTPDVSMDADSNGQFTATVPVCQPIGYKTYTPVDWNQTRDTYEVHQVWGYETSGTLNETVNSVSISTSKSIPALLGVEWTTGTGIIAGTAFDCNEDPITGAEVIVKAADGSIVDADIFYFVDEFPNQNQAETSEDGLWVVVNVPTGTWNVEMYGWDGSTHVLLGATTLEIKADSVNISNIYTGHEDGIAYPASCLAQ